VDFDLIIVNDINAVPLSFNHFNAKKYFIDLHEYSTAEIDDRSFRKFIQKAYLEYLCRKYLPMAFAVTSVNETISNKIADEFNIKVDTINNAPFYADLSPTLTNKDHIKIIHHGAAMESRRIELMIEAAKLLDSRFSMDFMLVPNEPEYFEHLKKCAADVSNVRFIPPVKHEEIVKFCNTYDIGIFILPPVNPNYEFALPNKFFEFVQSRLAVVTGPSPEMMNLIKRYDIGIVTETFRPEEVAGKINKLNEEEIMKFKQNSDSAAKELSFENNKNFFMK
jgi:glycosyltransferase involved in cell wall biosynthesis